MTVDLAPPPQNTAARYGEDKVHSAFFYLAVLGIILGTATMGLSRAWAARASDLIVFPASFDQTAVMQGQVTYHVDPHTLLRLTTPETQTLEDSHRTQTPSTLDQRALVITTDAFTIAGTYKATLLSQYLIDVRSLKNVKSPIAWSFAGGNVADRSSAYTVNLPFDTGPGPYRIWVNEVGRPVTVARTGPLTDVDDVTVESLSGHLDPSPVDPLYMTQLARAGVPAGVTLQQLTPMLTSLGDGVPAMVQALRNRMTGQEIATLDTPVPLDYTASADTSLLVEPHGGTIVAVERMAEVFTAHLDPQGIATLTALLNRHRDVAGVRATLPLLARLAATPSTPVFEMSYGQTPASVKTLSAYAGSQRDWINRMTRVIPTTLLAGGLAVIGLGVLSGAVAWRRRGIVWTYEDEE